MIFLDTSVLIDYFKGKNKSIDIVANSDDAVTTVEVN